MALIKGSATPQNTKAYFTRFGEQVSHRPLGKTGFAVSAVGFGGYRVSDGNATHHEALRLAILSGCNLIDTSTNYGNGGSELLIGDVLDELIAGDKIAREEIVLVTKVGYVQGDNMTLARERIARGKPFPEMVEYDPDCWHCISPEFIEDQITRSLERMDLEQIDVLLLHNPEYFLKSEGDHREYYRRIRQAFDHLEKEVKHGRIQYYGVSSNTFPAPRESEQYTSLEAIWDIVQEMGTSRFAVIQFPLNLFEPGGALEENNSGKSVLKFAREKHLGTLINRPLNAFHNGELVRLADFPAHEERDIVGDLKSSWTRVMELESQVPDAPLKWGHILKQNFQKLQDLDQWKNFLKLQIRPSIQEFVERDHSEEMQEWSENYQPACALLLDAFTAYLENQASYRSDLLSSKLDHACPPLHDSQTLSQKVIRLYLSLEGLDCVLLGMRRPEYVRDALRAYSPVSRDEALKALSLMQES